MSKYGLFGRIPSQPEKGDELEAILLRAGELMRQAPGCHLYLVARKPEDPVGVYVYELWDSPADHQASLKLPGVGELIASARPLIGGPPEQTILEVKGGTGYPINP